MEALVRKHVRKMAQTMGYDAEREAVIAYGLLAIVQIGVTVVLALLAGLLIGAPIEAMIVCFSVSLLRKYSGGAHAHSAGFCTVITIVVCTLAAVLSRWLSGYYQLPVVIAASVITFVVAFSIVYRYAPVDSPNKPIKTIQKRQRMRKGCFSVLAVYAVLQVLLIGIGVGNAAFRAYGISLLLGVCWQTFTLTKAGSILLNKLNDLPKSLRKEDSI